MCRTFIFILCCLLCSTKQLSHSYRLNQHNKFRNCNDNANLRASNNPPKKIIQHIAQCTLPSLRIFQFFTSIIFSVNCIFQISDANAIEFPNNEVVGKLKTINEDISLIGRSENDAIQFISDIERTRNFLSDEFAIVFDSKVLGIKFVEKRFEGGLVITVEDIKDPIILQKMNDNSFPLRKGAILTGIGSEKVAGYPLSVVSEKITTSARPLTLEFRDPSRFFELLDSTKTPAKKLVTASYLPANARGLGEPEQIIKVERIELPPVDERRRSTQLLDVMEIQYIATLEDDENTIVDSSAKRSAPGSSAKSIYYVLGERNGPPGKFPKGWDLTLRGMVVNEVRKITLPYSLAYDKQGDKALKIPPRTNIVYTVKLLSIT